MHVTAYSPMGHGKSYWNDSVACIREKEITEIAAKHGVTPGQVLHLWFPLVLHLTKLIINLILSFYPVFPHSRIIYLISE